MKPLTLSLVLAVFLTAGDSSYGQIFRRGRPGPPAVQYRNNTVASQPTQDASKLIDFVREQQRRFVRPSFSETDCFTLIHLEALKALIASAEFATLVKTDPDFTRVAESLKQLTPAQRSGAYNAALRISRRTWREMGAIDRAGRGQTEAGQQGDILVGQQVVRLVRKAVGG